MSEPEKFLDRWSRRKRETVDETAPVEAKNAAPPPASQMKEAAAEVAFDPASLPPIESITAESDIRAFLKPGVPPELKRAALRRVWSADPAIRDFIGLVENPWNFNDPHGVPGFGPMPVGENIATLLSQAIGAPPPEQTVAPQKAALAQGNSEQNPRPAVISGQPQALPQDQAAPFDGVAASEKVSVPRSETDAAMQNISDEREEFPPPRRRGHGGALPK